MVESQRGRGKFPLSTRPSTLEKFASTKGDQMPTAKSMRQEKDNKIRQAEEAEYLGRPPDNKELIQVTHILPGKELLPSGLDDPGVFDNIRKEYRIYITRDVPNVLDIRCESMPRLRKALHAINWAIRNMRLSNDSTNISLLVQNPTNAPVTNLIQARLGTRPYFDSRNPELLNNSTAMDRHLSQLTTEINSSSEGLIALNKTLGLRVNFGHVVITKKKRDAQDEISHSDLVDLMRVYSRRGGAVFHTRLDGYEKVEEILRFLLQPGEAVCTSEDEIKRGCEITVRSNGLDIKTEGDYTHGKGVQLAMVRATRPEQWARLNWTVAAPDMNYDWNFRVDAWDQAEVPLEFKDLARKVSIATPDDDTLLPVPRVDIHKLASLKDKITDICAKSWVIVPFKDSNYALKFNITKTLKEPGVAEEPEVTWGVELYAPHWEESVNHASGGRKDWGQGLENIWAEGNDLESRLGSFMRTILEVQGLLTRADAGTASS
ncbi:uncharacterized protein FIESC28_11031 [Fusarium coffeatum]|uniref:DUF7905 domain-containing protein n=1 Tax=Fusarium coffeatum TaxID=231269 RepID=A0A366QNL1_9HYPO|nr:uncharacterized protein FIESC28_11031 [Fusarium coffeatum]RBR06519.1 hypothetical protein FIESC28_11031 [Fusarium coffeatum]